MSRELAYAHLAELRDIVARREYTDRIVPLWLPYTAVLLVLTSTVLAALGRGGPKAGGAHTPAAAAASPLEALATLLFIAGLAVWAYTVYSWVWRRDEHFERSRLLHRTLVDLLESLRLSDPELAVIRGRVEEMREREKRRGAVLWALATLFIGILFLYVAHFLTRDFAEHEERERSIALHLSKILERRGIHLAPPQRTVEHNNTALYIILSIVTLGLFTLYWAYLLTVEPNRHLREHASYEDRLLDALEKLVEKS